MARPLIGITGPSSFSTDMMRTAEKMLGANFVLLYHDDTENLNHWLGQVQGMIFSGGVDIHPAVYNHSVTTCHNLSKFDYLRDLREIRLLDSALNKNIPVMGVCRGHQLLGIYHGMKILQDISMSNIAHAPSKSGISLSKEEPAHLLKLISPDEYYEEYNPATSYDHEALNLISKSNDKKEKILINSFHHQGLLYQEKVQKPGVRILGVSYIGLKSHDKDSWDNIVEFMDGGKDPWISVQWHPEYDWEINSHSFAVLNKFKKMVLGK